jgi:hypothetical protein
MNSAEKLSKFIIEQDWDPSETMTALIMMFGGLTYQLGLSIEESDEVCHQAMTQIHTTMDELMRKGSRTLQ